MAPSENFFYWLSFFIYILASIAQLGFIIFKRKKLRTTGWLICGFAFIAETVAIITRWVITEHPPLFGTFENTLAASWTIILFSFIVAWKFPETRNLGIIFFPMTSGLLAWGLSFNQHHLPLTISERSLWVDIHVIFAWLAFGSFLTVWVLAVKWLKARKTEGQQSPEMVGDAQEYLGEIIFKFLAFGFITFTIMLALGSFYEFILFGQWWQWDVIETLSLITWLLYGLIIHIFLFYPRRKALATKLLLVAPLGILISYLGLSFLHIQTFHNFDLPF